MRKCVLLWAACWIAGSMLPAQEPSPYALRVQSRLVVEDVSVLDQQGKPVSGLPLSAFHVLDDGKPQTVRDLQELRGTTAADETAPADAGTVTNATLLRNQGVVVALLIDPSTMMLDEQMYLRLQALKFVESAAPGTSMAVFRVNSAGVPVLLQPLTRDKAQLRTAISAAVPKMTRPISSEFRNAVVELENISAYLRPVPGRKAVLWLAGAFPLYVPPDVSGLCVSGSGSSCGNRPMGARLDAQQRAYRALAEARVAVYPVDVRGVQMGGLTAVPVLDRGPAVTPGNIGAKPTSENERITGQYDEMDRLADATGGRAFYSANHVGDMMNRAVRLASEGYTLTYRPTDDAADGRWHTVRVRVDGPYTVRYRTGYYAANKPGAEGPSRPMDEAESKPVQTEGAVRGEPDGSSTPLVFSAQVVADGKPGKTREVRVRYVIPSDQLLFDGTDLGHAHFQVSALGYNTEGDVLSQAMQVVDTRYTAQQKRLAVRIGTPAEQTIEVAKGAKYLLLAVEDLRTEKVGVVQLPLAQVDGGTGARSPAR